MDIHNDHHTIQAFCTDRFQRRYGRLVGRGTTALYVALRAVALRDGLGEIILPDLICSTVLDAVLLAGFTPVFADVSPDRFTLSVQSIMACITPHTRAGIVAHLFGHVTDFEPLGVPIIEDAVQGLGGAIKGKPVGTLGTISFTSFDPTKMIGGRGGLVATDDPAWWEALREVSLTAFEIPRPAGEGFRVRAGEEAAYRYAAYREQISATAPALICPFNDSIENMEQIEVGWQQLAANVQRRNEKARIIRHRLRDLPLTLPDVHDGDAIWRYTFAAPDRIRTSWILRKMQQAGLNGSHLYPSLSAIFAPDPLLTSAALAPLLINTWVDSSTTAEQIERLALITESMPM